MQTQPPGSLYVTRALAFSERHVRVVGVAERSRALENITQRPRGAPKLRGTNKKKFANNTY